MLDVAVRAEHERLGADAGGEVVDLLAGHRVEPPEPVGSGDGDDAAVAEVDQRLAGLEQTLFAHRVAVVRRDPGVESVGFDGVLALEQRRPVCLHLIGFHGFRLRPHGPA